MSEATLGQAARERKAGVEDAAAGEMTPLLKRIGVQKTILAISGIVGLLLIWQGAVSLLNVAPYVLPSPRDVFSALASGLSLPLSNPTSFYIPLAATLSNAGLGFVFGALAGIVLGSLMAEFRPIETILMPYTFALQSLPKVAIAPLIVIWCGFGDGSKITMAALLVFFPIMVNTFTGIRAADRAQLDLMRSLSASRFETYRIVKVPAAAPFIFAGIDMAVVYALLGAIIAEFLGTEVGIGATIIKAQSVSDVASVFAALILLAIVGILLHITVQTIDRLVVHWVRH